MQFDWQPLGPVCNGLGSPTDRRAAITASLAAVTTTSSANASDASSTNEAAPQAARVPIANWHELQFEIHCNIQRMIITN